MTRFVQRSFLALVLFWCAHPAAHAEELLTWQACVSEARQSHPDLASAQELIHEAEAEKAITRGVLLPQISGTVNQTASRSAATGNADTYTYGIAVQQLLFDGFKSPYDVAAASETIKSAHYQYAVTSSEVRLRLRTAFVDLLQAREFLTITGRIADRRRQNLALVRLRYEAGREHKGSVLAAEADRAQAQFEVSQARRNSELARRRLGKELGRRGALPTGVKGDFRVLSGEGLTVDFEALADKNPVLHERIALREGARFNLKAARANLFPQIYANASAGRTSSDWPPDQNEWSVGLGLTLPIFEGGVRRAGIAGASARLKQAEADERSSRDTLLVTLQEAWTVFRDSAEGVRVRQKFLEAAQARAKIGRAQYSTGLISFDTWTIIEDDLVRAEKSFLTAQADASRAHAGWIYAQGGTLDYAEAE